MLYNQRSYFGILCAPWIDVPARKTHYSLPWGNPKLLRPLSIPRRAASGTKFLLLLNDFSLWVTYASHACRFRPLQSTQAWFLEGKGTLSLVLFSWVIHFAKAVFWEVKVHTSYMWKKLQVYHYTSWPSSLSALSPGISCLLKVTTLQSAPTDYPLFLLPRHASYPTLLSSIPASNLSYSSNFAF